MRKKAVIILSVVLIMGLVKDLSYAGDRDIFFHIIESNNGKKVTEMLTKNRSLGSTTNKDGEGPLHCAVLSGAMNSAQALLAKDVDVNSPDKDKCTPLHWAARLGNRKMAALLLDNGAEVKARNSNGETPLHMAACTGSADVTALLLDHEADVKALDNNSYTPLHSLGNTSFFERAENVLKRGNTSYVNTQGMRTIYKDEDGERSRTALLLIKKGADVNAQSFDARTPLFFIAGQGFFKTADVFVKAGANVNACRSSNESLLCDVVSTGQIKMVKYLLDHGADPNSRIPCNVTPLTRARETGRSDVVDLLIRYGAKK